MNINLLILISGITANLLLGLFVYLRNRRSATSLLFFLLTVDISFWSAANYLTLQFSDLLTVLYWTRIVMALAVPQAILFFLLIYTLPSAQLAIRATRLTALIIVGIITMGFCISPYLFPSIIFVDGAPSPTPGPAMPLFVVVAVGSVFAGILTLIKRLKSSKGIIRSQLQAIGLGVVVMFALILFFNFVLVVIFQVSSFVSFSPLYTLPFVIATAYAVIRHKFLDIRIVIARAVSYAVLISIFGLIYALVFSSMASLLVTPYIDPKFVVLSTVAALVMLLTFPSVKRVIERATDAVFFKNKYDTPQVLYRLAKIMATSLRLEDLTHQFLQQLNKELRISKSCIVLIHGQRIFTIISEGYDLTPELHESVAVHASAAGGVHHRDDEQDPLIQMVFESLDASVLLPLETSEKVIGFLCIGERLSGERYSDEDVHVLEIISPEVGVAIENSLSYEEIRRFNMTLEDEVSRATLDLRGANEKLRQLDKLKDEFVSLASHELRTPLTSIRSYLWMALSGKGGVVTEKQKYYLDRAFSSADRLIRLVNDMLNISRIESGRLSVQFSRSDIRTIIRDVVAEVQPKIDEQGLHLAVKIPQSSIPDVIADTDKIKEVFINLIGNAIKFTPWNGRITIAVRHEGEYIKITVTDSGKGFNPALHDKLFTKFGTLEAPVQAASASSQSTGLGLFICKSIIELHGGVIEGHSDGKGMGAEFSFSLPVYTAQKREVMQKKHSYDGLAIIHSPVL